jgi:hypothetical protein
VARWKIGALAVGLASSMLPGCAGFWDEVTSRDFKFQDLYTKPNPLQVLKDSNDGDHRARALRALQEPKQNGGSQQEQDAVLKILVTAASAESQFLCRVAAVQSLGRFQDPRAVSGLTDAFYNSGSYPQEQATRLQCLVAQALGETHNPAAVPFLVKVARGAPAEGSAQEKQQVLDVRIAAAKALGAFHNRQASEGLVRLLQTDKDVALCNCVFESLQSTTGRKLPSDFKDFDDLLRTTPAKDQALVQSGTDQAAPATDGENRLVSWKEWLTAPFRATGQPPR